MVVRQAINDEITVPDIRIVREPPFDWPEALLIFPGEPTTDHWLAVHNALLLHPEIPGPHWAGK